MREIDLDSWPRKKHFEVFNSFDYPHFNLCANVEITSLHDLVKTKNLSLHTTLVYIISRAANDFPEFRWRIRADMVIEHEVAHPSSSILTDGNLFSFCTMEFDLSFAKFYRNAEAKIAQTKLHPTLEDEPGEDNLYFLTSLPWVSFTGFMHPIHMHPVDSIPRFSWGKYFSDGDQIKIPLSVQVHHALMDGFHVGRYYQHLQKYLDLPNEWLDYIHS